MKSRVLKILIAFDIFLFALLTLGGSKRNESISAACYELDRDGKWQGKLFRPLIDFLLRPLGPKHCFYAWEIEQ